MRWEIFDEVKLSLLSLFLSTAWVVAAEGWVRAVALVWLVYPAVVAYRAVRRSQRS